MPAGLALDEDEADAEDWRWRGRMSTAVGGDMAVLSVPREYRQSLPCPAQRGMRLFGGEGVAVCGGSRSVRDDRTRAAGLRAK